MISDAEAMEAEAPMAEPSLEIPAPTRAKPPSDPWLRRRMLGFGASDIPALLVGLGLRAPESVPDKMRANAAIIRGTLGQPRIIAEKARFKKPLKHGGGGERERDLITAWISMLDPRSDLVPSTLIHIASVIPRDLLSPLRDPECPELAVNLDAVCRDIYGDGVVIEAKCADPDQETDAWPKDGSCPWFWATQVQAQLAATGYSCGVVVCGVGMAYRDEGPIRSWEIERDESAIEELRQAAREGWRRVEAMR